MKNLSPLLILAISVAREKYLSTPYTDIFEQENLRHYNNLAKIQLKRGVVHRPNHNIIHTLRSLRYVRYIVDMLLKYGVPSLQSQLISIKNNGKLESFCQQIELASIFKVAGRNSEISRPDSVELYTRYRTQSALAFRDFVDSSEEARQLFYTVDEIDFYQRKVVEDLGNPDNKELPQLILRLAHDLDLQRCRSSEAIQTMRRMYDSQYLQSGYTFEPLWQFAKSCISETGGSVVAGYNEQLYDLTENPIACWEILSAKAPYEDPLYRESVKGNLNLNEISRIIRKGNAIARVVTLPDIELKMLSDPRHVRPIIETTKDRTLYTDQRNDKTGNVKFIHRSRKHFEPIEKQRVVLSTTYNLEKYRDDNSDLLPRSILLDADRGKPKETPYSKKMAVSRVHTNGKYIPYADNRLGFLYDDALLHHKGDRYIWIKNAGSITKPWLNGLITHSITTSALQIHMRINTNDKINNELLRGLTLHGLRACFYPYNSTERINLFCEYLIARDSYHNFPRVPLLLWEYDTDTIYFYDINLIRSDLAKSMENKTLSSERLQKVVTILGIEQTLTKKPEQLVSDIVEQFVRWEYYSFTDPAEKARELLFQQIVSILENMKSQKELESLGIFSTAAGKIFHQPVQVNCESSHVVNFDDFMRAEHSAESDCENTVCPTCKQAITEINMAHAVIDKMYSVVTDIIRTKGVREILPHAACKMNMDSLQSLFNRNDEQPTDLLCLVARNLAERAIKQYNLPLLIQLMSQDHLKKYIVSSSQLLYVSALNCSNQMLNCLIQYGAEINGYDEDRGTPLHYAAFHGSGTAIQKLLNQGANPSSLNRDGLTALHIAAQYGNNTAVDALLSAPSLAVDWVNLCDGYTPLLTAVKYGHHEIVEKLISHHANIGHINNVGDSALHIAAEYGYEKVIDLLLKKGADANYSDKSGAIPLFRAAAYGREGALQLLLENNIQHIDRQNKLGDTALHMAVKFGRIATVKILLEKHANAEISNQDGESALHLAIKFNRQNIVCELMQHGVDFMCKNNSGETPLMLAKKNFDKSLLACFTDEQNKREAKNSSQLERRLF